MSLSCVSGLNILVDADMVCVDMRTDIDIFLEKNYGIIMSDRKWLELDFSKNPFFNKIIYKELVKLVQTKYFLLDLKPLPFAAAAFNILARKNKCSICTSRTSTLCGITMKWLIKNNFNYTALFCGEDKRVVSHLVNADIFIEDQPNKIDLLLKNPELDIILFDHPWNGIVKHKRVYRAYSWMKYDPEKPCVLQRVVQIAKKRGKYHEKT